MADTEQVLEAARDLGVMIASTEQASKFEAAVKAIQQDTDAQRLMVDLNRHASLIMQKQAEGRPIEVQDKHKLEDLRGKVSTSITLCSFQMAQMDFLDLMRSVDEAISEKSGAATAMGQAPDLDPSASMGTQSGGGSAGPVLTE